MSNSEFCFTHDPKMEEERKIAVIKGGKAPKRNYQPLPLVKLKDAKSVIKLLSMTINEVRQGEIDLRVANCIGYLSGHLIKAFEVAGLEERIGELEKIVWKRFEV